MQVTFDHATQETDTIWTYYFRAAQPMRYQAGQYIELRLPPAKSDAVGDKRWLTLSSAPTDPLLSVTTILPTVKRSRFKKTMASLPPGSVVYMSEPMGDFVLPKDTSRALIFVAGGIGVTPFHSIAQSLIQAAEPRPIRCFYAVKTEAEIVFQDSFRAAQIPTTVFVQQPSPSWSGQTGHITAQTIISQAKPAADSLIYIAGPEKMVEDLRSDLIDHGIAPDQIVGDYFPGYIN